MKESGCRARVSERVLGGKTIMIRSTLAAATLGALVAASALYLLCPTPRQNTAAARPGTDRIDAQPAVPAEAWPICSSMGSLAESADWMALDPDFAAGKRAIVAGDWKGAIEALTSAGLRDDRNADIQNYLGYAYRRLRQLAPAMQHYRRALILNPRHRSAHEHLGEAHLVNGNLGKAEEHLVALNQICLIPCEEYDDLMRAIAEYNKIARHWNL